jgi:two-component system chemotaxis response regulator CheB
MTSVISTALGRAGIEVVGVAANGDDALECCERLAPDVLSLDLAMPGRDGVGVLRELRARDLDIPVVVVSAFSRSAGTRAVDALAEGAFDLVPKPANRLEFDSFVKTLAERVLLAGRSSRRGRKASAPPAPPPSSPRSVTAGQRVVLIACSTGGPRALAALLPRLPTPLGNGTLIVQHMPGGFTAPLAARLDRSCELQISEAHGNEHMDAKRALLAPGGHHLRILADGTTALSDDPPVGGLRPRADITIADAATVWGKELLLVVLTGMGRDGLAGAHAVRKAGGRILVEAESSCVVYGMPRAISEAGLADGELDLDALPRAIAVEAGR